jgi:cobalt transporter subunit CbtB
MVTMATAPFAWTAHSAAPPIPISELLSGSLLGIIIALILGYFVVLEQGAAALLPDNYLHELVHDGRHMLNVPCH